MAEAEYRTGGLNAIITIPIFNLVLESEGIFTQHSSKPASPAAGHHNYEHHHQGQGEAHLDCLVGAESCLLLKV